MTRGLPSLSRRRSRRLRKKLRIAEFKEEGFEIDFKFTTGLTQDQQVDFLFTFIDEVVEPRGLLFGGGENGYITRAGRNSATEADREAVRAWLEACVAIHSVEIGSLEDAWYGKAASEA
jgi:uncharacterized protein